MSITTFQLTDPNGTQREVTVYVSLDEAGDIIYEDVAHRDAWFALDSDPAAQQRLIIGACFHLDRERYLGRKTLADQPRQWPRDGVIIDNEVQPDNLFPGAIEWATAILAVRSISDPTLVLPVSHPDVQENYSGNIAEVQSGEDRVRFKEGAHLQQQQLLNIRDNDVYLVIEPYLAGAPTGNQHTFVDTNRSRRGDINRGNAIRRPAVIDGPTEDLPSQRTGEF